MSMSKLSVQRKMMSADSKMLSERKYQLDELARIETKDRQISQFLNSDCCDSSQTAQFFHYMASKPCTSICKTIDIPSQKEWGGWYQSNFLVFYTRSLYETSDKITQQLDSIPHTGFDFSRELEIAKRCFQSAQERNLLESTKKMVIAATGLYDNAATAKTMLMASAIAIANQHGEKIYQLRHNEESIQFCQTEMEASQAKIDQFEVDHNGIKLTKYKQNKLMRMSKDLAHREKTLHDCRKANRHIHFSIQDLVLQHGEKQAAIQQQDAVLLKKQQEQRGVEEAFHAAQKVCIQNLISRVSNLKIGENYCHAAGFKGHAIYINFENLGDRVQAKICNLGAGLNHHPIVEGRQLYLPVVINFSQNKSGKDDLYGFCQSITKAITEDEAEATPLIYQSGYGIELTTKEYSEYYSAGKISGELEQITGNCTAKGYFQALRERTKNAESYANLMFSLFAWSKNLYFLRRQQTPIYNMLITAEDFTDLKKSEAVFKDKNENWFMAKLNQLKLTALAPIQLLENVGGSATAAMPPLLAAFSRFQFDDSQLNEQGISEDELFYRLHKQ